jgi:hypothetical protein
MDNEIAIFLRASGLLAILGAFVYATGDVLLLASKASLADYLNLQPYARLLSGAEKMVVLPWRRLIWGGLLGVFATLLVLPGFWLVYQALSPAGLELALPPALFFIAASVIGAFVHGSFIYLGEYVQALNQIGAESQPVVAKLLSHHRTIMTITYGFVAACVLLASLWYSVLVALGKTLLPAWMAAINPIIVILAWLLLKRILPARIRDYTEGAGFNIGYLIFFISITAAMWQ